MIFSKDEWPLEEQKGGMIVCDKSLSGCGVDF